MQKISAVAVVFAAAGTAWATPVLGDYSTYTQISADNVSAVSMDDTFANDRVANTVYSNMDSGSGFAAFGPAQGMGFDDYVSTSASAFDLTEMRFVGGLVTGGDLIVEFFDSTGTTLLNAFSVGVGAGNFIYTITISGGFTIDGAGIVQMSTNDLTGGQWFMADAGPTIGTEDNMFGGTADGTLSHNFELTTPAPGAFALLGLGGLVATRRRR